jgi:midasin (ATPase involved in ribosome maturation)
MEILKFDNSLFLPDYQKFIPQMPKELIMDLELKAIANAIYFGDCIAFLQHGQTGTGKTINCKLICEAINLPILETINCTENLDEFVLGKYLPTNDKIVFCESFVTKAIRDGGAVIFEEINFAKPQYLAFLNSLLDDNGFVRLDNNEIVKRNKNFRFFATMNYGYFGTKDINQALYNRFQIIYKANKLTDEKIKNMLLFRVPSCSQYLSKMLKVYHKICEKIEREELDFIISPRNLESWARLASQIGYVDAAKHTITQISKGDSIMEEAIMNIINLFKWT